MKYKILLLCIGLSASCVAADARRPSDDTIVTSLFKVKAYQTNGNAAFYRKGKTVAEELVRRYIREVYCILLRRAKIRTLSSDMSALIDGMRTSLEEMSSSPLNYKTFSSWRQKLRMIEQHLKEAPVITREEWCPDTFLDRVAKQAGYDPNWRE